MDIQYALFDLDGTITDPAEGITNSIIHALKEFGIEPPPREQLFCFIGPPLLDSFEQHFAMTPEKSRQALAFYREYYADRGIYENTVYEGIPEMLKSLIGCGVSPVIATSKPEPYAVEILRHFGLIDFFTFVGGCNMDETRTKKGEVISYVLESLPVTDRQNAVMIGDRKHDIIGAKENRISSVGVLYGYGSREELTAAGADHICEKVADLRRLLCE